MESQSSDEKNINEKDEKQHVRRRFCSTDRPSRTGKEGRKEEEEDLGADIDEVAEAEVEDEEVDMGEPKVGLAGLGDDTEPSSSELVLEECSSSSTNENGSACWSAAVEDEIASARRRRNEVYLVRQNDRDLVKAFDGTKTTTGQKNHTVKTRERKNCPPADCRVLEEFKLIAGRRWWRRWNLRARHPWRRNVDQWNRRISQMRNMDSIENPRRQSACHDFKFKTKEK
jgi:hypothetical protein